MHQKNIFCKFSEATSFFAWQGKIKNMLTKKELKSAGELGDAMEDIYLRQYS